MVTLRSSTSARRGNRIQPVRVICGSKAASAHNVPKDIEKRSRRNTSSLQSSSRSKPLVSLRKLRSQFFRAREVEKSGPDAQEREDLQQTPSLGVSMQEPQALTVISEEEATSFTSVHDTQSSGTLLPNMLASPTISLITEIGESSNVDIGGSDPMLDDHETLIQECQAISSPTPPPIAESELVLPVADSCDQNRGRQQPVLAMPERLPECKDRLEMREEDIGMPPDGLWEIATASNVRCCYDHGNEILLHYEPRWMQLSDFRESNVKTYLERLVISPDDVTKTGKENPTADCESGLLAQVAFVSQRSDWNGSLIYLVHWKPTWTQQQLVHVSDNWINTQLEEHTNRRPRWSKRIQKNTQSLMEKKEQIVRILNTIEKDSLWSDTEISI